MSDDPRIERLKLAFSLQSAIRIVEADRQILPAEERILHTFFPLDLLEREGLVDPETGQLTDAFDALRIEALVVLPHRLSLAEKQDILSTLHEICLSDGRMTIEESAALREAAKVLGLRRTAT